MNKLLQNILFQKPTDCKYCGMLSCGMLGATYTCVNEKSNCYFVYPVNALKSVYFMKKTRTPNVKTLFKQHRMANNGFLFDK